MPRGPSECSVSQCVCLIQQRDPESPESHCHHGTYSQQRACVCPESPVGLGVLRWGVNHQVTSSESRPSAGVSREVVLRPHAGTESGGTHRVHGPVVVPASSPPSHDTDQCDNPVGRARGLQRPTGRSTWASVVRAAPGPARPAGPHPPAAAIRLGPPVTSICLRSAGRAPRAHDLAGPERRESAAGKQAAPDVGRGLRDAQQRQLPLAGDREDALYKMRKRNPKFPVRSEGHHPADRTCGSNAAGVPPQGSGEGSPAPQPSSLRAAMEALDQTAPGLSASVPGQTWK